MGELRDEHVVDVLRGADDDVRVFVEVPAPSPGLASPLTNQHGNIDILEGLDIDLGPAVALAALGLVALDAGLACG